MKVTIKKYMGNDAYSWAVFVDGAVRLTGLSLTEARYYCDRMKKEGR